MAKAPGKNTKPAAKPVASPVEKPKAPKVAAKPKAPKLAAAAPTEPPAKAAKAPKAKSGTKSVLKQTSETISKLASDILADRIVPTIEQIKAVAASALGQDETGGKKKKKKK